MMNHTNCTHPKTAAARAVCRRESAAGIQNVIAANATDSRRAIIAARYTMPANTPKNRTGFPLTTCSRCGGTGQYPSVSYNGICLGCSGTGYVDYNRSSRRQRLAYETAVRESQATNVTDIRVGDRVIFNVGFMAVQEKWLTVTAVEDDKLNAGHTILRAGDENCTYDNTATVRRSAARVDPAPFLAKISYTAR